MPAQQIQTPIVIGLCSYNGARWLGAQLDSIAAQTHQNWSLWISDDGSTDGTQGVVAAFQAAHPDHDIRLIQGPRQGAAQNFLSLLCHPDLPLATQTHLALSDQDDLWLPEKLARGLAVLAAEPDGMQPLIYGGQSRHIDEAGQEVGRSRRPRRPVCLQNAVVQNMVSGHSLILNPAALALARRAGRPADVAFQDWWLGLLVMACGGRAVVDQNEVLLYRQHQGNVIGAPQGIVAQVHRVGLLFGQRYARWLAANLAGLRAADLPLTPEARQILQAMAEARNPLARTACLRRLGLHRQSRVETGLLYLATLLGRV